MTTKGIEFEYSVMDFFQQNGYFARQGVPFKNNLNGNIDATDIDVYGIQFMGLFEPYVITCDCKNKAKAKPFERIFWAKGLGKTVNVDKIYVALNRVSDEIIEFAKNSNVTIISNDVLKSFVKEECAYGLSDYAFYSEIEKNINDTTKSISSLEDLLIKTKKIYLNKNPYVNINVCMDSLFYLGKWFKFDGNQTEKEKQTLKYLIAQFTVLLGLQILWICSDTIGFTEKYRKQYILNKLAYGNNDPNYIDKIFSEVSSLANEIVKSSIPTGVATPSINLGKVDAPNYSDSLVGLVERAFINPQSYIKLPQYLDFYFFESRMKYREFSTDEIERIMKEKDIELKLKAVKNVIAFVKEYTNLDITKVFQSK